MDPLSDILSLLRPRSYITAGFDAGGDWLLRLDDLHGRIKCYAVVRGSCWLEVEEDAAGAVRLDTGDCFVLPTGRAARIGSNLTLTPARASEVLAPDRDGGTVVYNGGGDVLLVGARFELGGQHAAGLLRSLPAVIHLHAARDQALLRSSIELMMQELQDREPGASLIAQHLAHMMLAQTLRLYLARQSGTGMGWFAALADPHLGAALGAIHADPARDWTLENLARCAGQSRTVFARRFRQVLDETPIAYLTRWRMLLAAERLLQGREPLARIAQAVGYDSENAFNTAFARVMGDSPRRYASARRAVD
ncbi:AraC family transcriptional regulator [Coralloluteibacterium stylophorae]|uniref:AraC family transcriptional regulator n=1 Tax=Coralloluteibacterium stylophorae TaxID=1776034 RepID=A0A8J8AWV5_9GAMM|nr:AraC family transcriptional regulator [Coralloluteibacterium stylophorae]